MESIKKEQVANFLERNALKLTAVTHTETKGSEEVFDISIEDESIPLKHSFMANGIVTHNSFQTDYIDKMATTFGIKLTSEQIFGLRNPKNQNWEIKPLVRLYNEVVGEKFFDYLARLERLLPDKKLIGENWYYIYENTKPNKAIVGERYDKKYFQKTGMLRIPAQDGKLQALILLDSYPAMLPEKQDVDDPNSAIAVQARMFSEQLKRVKGRMRAKRIAVLGVNQLRKVPMAMFGPTEQEPCGQALAFFSDCRLKTTPRSLSGVPVNGFKGKGMIMEENSVSGKGTDKYRFIHVKAIKNKLSVPNLETWIRLWIEDSSGEARGFDLVWDCVTGDTLLPTTKGMIRIDEIYKYGELAKDGTYDIYDISVESNTGEYPITRWGIRGVKKVYEITTEKGYSVKASANHQFQIINNRGITWKCVKDITNADCLLLAKNFVENVNEKIIKLNFKGTNNSNFKASDITIPKTLNSKLAEFMGLIISDGTTTPGSAVFYTSDRKLLYYVEKLGISLFGIKPFKQEYKSKLSGNPAFELRFHSIQLAKLLEELDMPSVKCYNLHIPRTIFSSNSIIQASFISGLMAGDGCYEKKSHTIHYCSSSETLLKNLQVMLLGLGIISKRTGEKGISTGNRVIISGINSLKFTSIIPTPINKKPFKGIVNHDGQSGLRLPILMGTQNATVGAVLNNRHRGTRYERLLDRVTPFIVDNDLIVDKISSIKYIGKEQTYDIEVQETHNFIANGFIAHNCFYYLRQTGQLLGDGKKMTLQLDKGPTFKKSLTWLGFKLLILGTTTEKKETCTALGASKPINLRPFCQKQMESGAGLDLYMLHKSQPVKEKSRPVNEEGSDDDDE